MRILNPIATAFVMLAFLATAHAKDDKGPRLAVSQGISSPNVTSPVNLSHGFLPTNPAVAGTLGKINLTLEYGSTDENARKSSTGGIEIGAGTGSVGIAAGYLKSDCDRCEGRAAGMVGASFDSVALGIGFYEEKSYTLGFTFNPKGTHRVGLMGSLEDRDREGEDLRAYGLGYSYHADSVVFALDASKRERENRTASDDVILITPGLQVKIDWLALSVSHTVRAGDQTRSNDDGTWFGVGIDAGDMYFAIYHDYFHEWSLTGTFWF